MNQQLLPRNAPAEAMPWRWRDLGAAALLALVLVVLAACGGGGDVAGVGTGGTGSFSVGPISGFGSIVVNGVHFDESAASVVDDDGNPSDASALRLGMVVEIRGSVAGDGKTGSAVDIAYAAEIEGPVTAVDAVGGTFRVFDRPVTVTPTTVYDGVSGVAGLAGGNVVRVFGLPGADGTLAATRIEFESASIAAFIGEFRVRGAIDTLSGAAPNWRFTVAGVTVTTNGATQVSGALAAGAQVGVRLSKTAASDGSYVATSVVPLERGFADDAHEAELEGLIGEFTSIVAPFKVGGFAVQLASDVIYEGGVATDLGNGVRVEVEGDVASGVLTVHKLAFKHEGADGGTDGNDAPFDFKGTARCSPGPCRSPEGAIVVRGVTLRYDASTHFEGGIGPATLDGALVEVKAVAVTGATGSVYQATRIEPGG